MRSVCAGQNPWKLEIFWVKLDMLTVFFSVMGWLGREERRGYREGQFWYLIASDWWQQWQNYTSAPR